MNKRRADANDAVVGHNIRAQRLLRGLSKAALGDAVGVAFQQVQKYEKGRNRVGSGRLVRIAAVLGVPVTSLLRGVPDEGKADQPAAIALIANAQPLRLVRAFNTIGDKGVRRSLMSLTEAIARLRPSPPLPSPPPALRRRRPRRRA
jgi:transcriptional regulator with XRE-family HTH domain